MTERSPSPAAIEVTGLVKVFKDFWRRPKVHALDGLDLTVRTGEIFGLLGPNGSGKSTTIKILLGLLFPDAGHVRVLGQGPRHVQVKQHIGYLPEDSTLYRYLTPRETLGFYGRLFGLDHGTVRERTAQLLDMVGLAQAADRPVGELSKGMARRIGLAQALINDPQLLILDEPTAGLDPIGCREIKDLIVTLAGRGKTILLTSHLLADVEDVCDTIAILYGGRVRAHGAVRELLKVTNRVTLTLPSLDADVMERALARLRETTGTEARVDHPAMDLERFFLQVTAEARSASAPSAGAAASAGLADFLRSPDGGNGAGSGA